MAHQHEVAIPQPSPCPECAGERVPAKALNTIRLIQPDLVFPDNRKSTELWALVCASCGHTSLYAKDPQKLLHRG